MIATTAMLRPRSVRLVPALAGLAVLAGQAATVLLAIPAAAAPAHRPAPLLTAIRAVHYPGYDRLVFQFARSLPARRIARYLDRRSTVASGGPVTVAGSAWLLVSFAHATGNDSSGVAYEPVSVGFALPDVMQVVTARDRGGIVSFVVGLARRESFSMFTLAHPSRVVIDVRTPFRTVQVKDYFVSTASPAATVAVSRPVIRPATVSGALRRLFAGPTRAELASGLRFVASGATGFRRLQLRGGVVRVWLTGGCGNGGSAFTVASEIVPTLTQFSSVRWVKIYDPAGNTERPAGNTDSIPVCLVPTAPAHGFTGALIIAVLVAAVVGILIGLMLSVLSVVTGLVRRPNLITPSAYRAERIKAKPVATGQFGPDTAWPFYPVRQMRADLSRIEADRAARYAKLWRWPGKPLVWILLLPVTAAAVICLVTAWLTTVLLESLLALVIWASAAVTGAAFAMAAVMLCGIERGWHTVMRTEASCPHCYHVTPRPAYLCPGCSALHRDIRPSRLGLLTRRCECGTLMPTMVLRAAWHLQAVCQRCEKPLRIGSAALRDVRIPIFGDTSAGKTRFLYAALDSLVAVTSRTGIGFGFPDEESENEATVALDLIRSGRDTVKTSMTLPTALTCRIGTGSRGTLVHLFDAAGESYRAVQMHDSLGFLDHGHGLVYVLDPFSVGSISDRVSGHDAAMVQLAHAAAGDPETAYGEVVTRLRDSGVKAAGQRLAIVVSKVDLLSAAGLELPGDSDAIAEWLTEAGVHNVVMSARREFAEVRYFLVASLAAGQPGRQHDPGAPLRWLLRARGVRWPAEPGEVGAAARIPRSHRSQDEDEVSSESGETAAVRP